VRSSRAVPVALVCATAAIVATAAGALEAPPQRSVSRAPAAVLGPSRTASASALAARLTTGQLAGQRIIYAYSGLNPPPSLLARIRAGEAAGVIFFGANIASPAQLRATVERLQRASAASPLHTQLLMMVDQEGGLVNRLPGPPALSERAIGASSHGAALAAQAGSAAAANLIRAGINVDLAPVLDVYRQPGNFIDQYQRSYSTNPATSAQLGRAFITHLQHAGVAATAKHFPGLGAASTDQNTDARPVALNLPLSELRRTDEVPYRSAISAGVKLVMVSWAVYPALDPRMPAGLSATVIGNELRGRLRFPGVTITDSLGAGAVARFGSYGERGVLAARAGEDLILCATTSPSGNTPDEGIDVLNSLSRGLATRTLSRTAAEQAAARVIQLRTNL
jgi:beta-N-acetylhexosaminidase